MSTHHKGDTAVGMTISTLIQAGVHVAIPMHQHLHYDLIAEWDNICYRIQVKHGSVNNIGRLVVSLRTVYQRKDGNHVRLRSANDYDILAAYNPVLNSVAFVKAVKLGTSGVTIDFNNLTHDLWW